MISTRSTPWSEGKEEMDPGSTSDSRPLPIPMELRCQRDLPLPLVHPCAVRLQRGSYSLATAIFDFFARPESKLGPDATEGGAEFDGDAARGQRLQNLLYLIDALRDSERSLLAPSPPDVLRLCRHRSMPLSRS
jgi:hypothetical protein